MKRLLPFILLITSVSSLFGQLLDANMRFFRPDDPSRYNEFRFEWDQPGKVQANLNEGLNELAVKRYDFAVYELTQAIEQMPSLAPAWYYRGVAYKLMDSTSQAILNFREAIRLAPKNPVSYVELSRIYLERRNIKEAHNLLSDALRLDKTFTETHFYLGNVAHREGRIKNAIKHYEECISLDPRYAKAFVQHALLKMKPADQNSDALELLNKAVAADKTYEPALFWRMFVHLNNRNLEVALADLNALVELAPSNTMFLFFRGAFYCELADFDKAFMDLKKIASMMDSDENRFAGDQSTYDKQVDILFATKYLNRVGYGLSDEAFDHLKRGFCLLFTGKHLASRDQFRKSYQQEQSAIASFFIGLSYEHSGKHDSAFYFYDRALGVDNDIFDAHKKRGIYRAEKRDWRGAFNDFSEMERIEPKMIVTYKLRGAIRKEYFKDYYGCILDMTKYIKVDTTNVDVFILRADARAQVKDLAGATKDFKKAMTLTARPHVAHVERFVAVSLTVNDTVSALYMIDECRKKNGYLSNYLWVTEARILIERRQFKDAQDVIAKSQIKLLHSYPVEADLAFLDGLTDFKRGNYDAAIRKFNKCLKADAGYNDARFYRSKAYLQIGNHVSAIEDLRALVTAGYEKATPFLAALQEGK